MFSIKKDVNSFGLLNLKLQGLKKKIPQAVVVALNTTRYQVLDALREQMKTDFDRPTPYTLGSLYATKATLDNLSTTVLPREFAGKGTPAAKYLKPEIYGGERRLKRFEKALQSVGVLPKGMYAYPGKGATMDAYGNMSPGQIVQIISYFNAFGQQGYRANMGEKGRLKLLRGGKKGFGFEYFVVRHKHGGLRPGIWKSTSARAGRYVVGGVGRVVVPVLIFGKKPTYTRRYRWAETAHKAATQAWPANYMKALKDLGL